MSHSVLVSDEQLLASHGWTVECKSPFEIRHVDGSFASRQAADCVISSLREDFVAMKFPDLALGARFKYLASDTASSHSRIWIKLSDEDCGLIAEYDPNYIQHPRWTGQQICCFADTPEQLKELDVILME